MRDQDFASDRFDEASMSSDTYIVGLMTSARREARRGFWLYTLIGMVHGPAAFAKAVFATWSDAYLVTHLAERYYAMNNGQLARLGLARDRLPAELRRVIVGS